MINIPLSKIKEKILEDTDLSSEALDKKIKEKLEQLKGLISEEGAAHIIANELGVKLIPSSGKLQIDNIVSGMRDVETVGKAYKIYEVREFSKGDRTGKVGNVMLADSTGTIRIVLWNDQTDVMKDMKEGDVVSIKSGYVRENRGKSEIHLNENSKVEINPSGVTVDVDVEDIGPKRKKLVDLDASDDNVEVMATVVQVFEPRFFEVCPGCGKRARESGDAYQCETHGTVNDPDYSYVMNVFLDDGSDNVRTVLWRKSVQALLGMEDDEVKQFREKPMDFEAKKTELLGNIIKVRGRVQRNDAYDRLELVANYINTDLDPEKEMKNLNKKSEKKVETNIKAELTSAKELEESDPKKEVESDSTEKKVEEKDDGMDEIDVEEEDIPSIDDL